MIILCYSEQLFKLYVKIFYNSHMLQGPAMAQLAQLCCHWLLDFHIYSLGSKSTSRIWKSLTGTCDSRVASSGLSCFLIPINRSSLWYSWIRAVETLKPLPKNSLASSFMLKTEIVATFPIHALVPTYFFIPCEIICNEYIWKAMQTSLIYRHNCYILFTKAGCSIY